MTRLILSLVSAALAILFALAASAQTTASTPAVPVRANCPVKHDPPSDAEAALAREDYSQAIDLYRKMVDANPDRSRAGVIRALLGQDNVKDAETFARAWVQQEPRSAPAAETLGEVLFRQGDIVDALKINQAAHKLDNCNPRVYLMDAALDDMLADFKTAKSRIELAHRLAPEDVEIRHAWIGTLSHRRRIEERTSLLKEERLLGAEEKDDLQQILANANHYSKDDCSLITSVESAIIPLVPILDGIENTGEVGLDVKFNGKNRLMQLDTGAGGLVLSKSAASRLGLTRELRIRSGGVGDKGDVPTSTAHVASVKIGNLEFRNCEVSILEKGGALENAGLIGGNVFSHFLLTLDFPKKELRVDPLPKRPEDKTEAADTLNTQNKPREPGVAGGEDEDEPVHDSYRAPEMKDWFKVYRYGHELLLPMRIGESNFKLFLVDTGADSMLISPAAAREVTKVKTNYDDHIRGISGEVNKVYQTGKFRIQFANLYQKVDSMTSIDTTKLSHDTGVEISGFLGAPILFRLAVHIDYRDNLMKFDYDPNR